MVNDLGHRVDARADRRQGRRRGLLKHHPECLGARRHDEDVRVPPEVAPGLRVRPHAADDLDARGQTAIVQRPVGHERQAMRRGEPSLLPCPQQVGTALAHEVPTHEQEPHRPAGRAAPPQLDPFPIGFLEADRVRQHGQLAGALRVDPRQIVRGPARRRHDRSGAAEDRAVVRDVRPIRGAERFRGLERCERLRDVDRHDCRSRGHQSEAAVRRRLSVKVDNVHAARS